MCLRWLLQSQAAKLSNVGGGQGERGWQTLAVSASLATMAGSWVLPDAPSAGGCRSRAARVTNSAVSSPVAYYTVSCGVPLRGLAGEEGLECGCCWGLAQVPLGGAPWPPWQRLECGCCGGLAKSPWEELPGPPGKGWSVVVVGVSPKSPWEELPGPGMGEDGSVGVPSTSPMSPSSSPLLLSSVAASGPPITPLTSGSSPPLPPYLGLLRREGSPSPSPSLLSWGWRGAAMAAAVFLSNRGNRERSTATASRQRTVVVVVSPVVGIGVSYCELCSDHFRERFLGTYKACIVC